MALGRWGVGLGLCLSCVLGQVPAPVFEVGFPEELRGLGQDARLIVVLAKEGDGEPRTRIGELGKEAPTLLGQDVRAGTREPVLRMGPHAAVFPWEKASEIPSGKYVVQALLMTNRDLWYPGAPGNRFSVPVPVEIGSGPSTPVKLELSRGIPPEKLPADRDIVRHRWIRSEVLSRFWGRDIQVRVGVALPRTWSTEPTRRYPVVLDIGGFGSRYDRIDGWQRAGSRRRESWLSTNTPQMIWVTLDGAGPLGDPYQVDSANHGPYGTALVEEILPALEHEFRGIGQPWARFTTGGSTGGWVSFALQVLYPDVFGGCWSGFPDPLDFRDFQLVNIYAHTNAFVLPDGGDRPSARTTSGETKFTIRHEVRYENILGLGNSFVRSGGQWGAWNATFGSRAADGSPVPAWDPVTGAMSREALRAWEKWDLRRVVEDNWPTLAPKLRGKLRVWVGEADEYYLNLAVHRMDEFLKSAQPPAEARFEYAEGRGHGWNPRGVSDVMLEMQAVVDRGGGGETGRDAYFRARFLHGPACVQCKGGR